MDKYEKFEPLKSHLRDLYEDLDNTNAIEHSWRVSMKNRTIYDSEPLDTWHIESTIDFVQGLYEKLVK